MGPKVELQKEVQFLIHSRLVLECSSACILGRGGGGGGGSGQEPGRNGKKKLKTACARFHNCRKTHRAGNH